MCQLLYEPSPRDGQKRSRGIAHQTEQTLGCLLFYHLGIHIN